MDVHQQRTHRSRVRESILVVIVVAGKKDEVGADMGV